MVRTRFLLHIIDIAPYDGTSPTECAQKIVKELEKFSSELAAKPRWLVINKADLLPKEELEEAIKILINDLQWPGPIYTISALAGQGTKELCADIMTELEHVQANQTTENECE